jgi:hypothetical protein
MVTPDPAKLGANSPIDLDRLRRSLVAGHARAAVAVRAGRKR